MKLDRVTITGADDSVHPMELSSMSMFFPFVEWGILVSERKMGGPRFPSAEWILDFQKIAMKKNLKASLHICGRWLRQLLIGETPVAIWPLLDGCQRAQLNFHGDDLNVDIGEFVEALLAISDDCNRQFIFQIDGNMGQEILAAVDGNKQAFGSVPLFDCSHGAGVLSDEWPTPFDLDTYHGYAGGLGPDNLAEQIPLISKAAGDCRIWIDMETKVRSNDDRQFDLAKVRRCLEIAKPFIHS